MTMTQLLIQFSYLQVLDFLTTIAFMMNGVREGNPLVKMAIKYSPSPIGGLLAVKIAAVMLGLYCWKQGRERLLKRMNGMFAIVVAWNVAVMNHFDSQLLFHHRGNSS